MATSEERIAEGVRNFLYLYGKYNRAAKKKMEKESIAWAGECLWLRFYLEKRLLCNSFGQRKLAPIPSSFHYKKRPVQIKMDSTSEDFKGVCETWK